jgi:predicted methyltransferase
MLPPATRHQRRNQAGIPLIGLFRFAQPPLLFYHDLHTKLIGAKGATAADFNRAVYERLKPGGSYVVVDHAAGAGAGTRDTQALHRIDPATVREEVEAAGFVLDGESTMVANRDDPHTSKVFDPAIKGETDRFAYRFVKR